MIKIVAFSITMVLLCKLGNGQQSGMIDKFNRDSLNQRDQDGKKHGWCIQYLKPNWKNCKKKKNAHFSYYLFYNHGKLNSFTNYAKWKDIRIDETAMDTRNKPVELNGKIMWYDKKGKLVLERSFNRGLKAGITWSYNVGGKRLPVVDYEKKFENQFPSYYLTIYHKVGFVKYKGYVRLNGSSGYMFMPESNKD